MDWFKAAWIGVALALLVSASSASAQTAKGTQPAAPPPAATKPGSTSKAATQAEPGPAAPQLIPGERPQLVSDLPLPDDPQEKALQDQLRALQLQLDKAEERSKEDHQRLQALEQEMPQVAAANERIKKLEAATKKLPETADVVSAGDFPGSLRIPGTDAALKIGGRVQVTLVDSFVAIGSGDRFVTSSIPIQGTATAVEGARLVMTAIPSRFNLDVRAPSKLGDVRAFIEADFAGANGTLRLRHAFAQWDRLVIGQTWSTFSDPEAEPDSIDFEGLNAISLFRQVQVRYTHPLAEKLALAASLESPKPEVAETTGVTKLPDLVLRLRWDAGRKLVGFGLLRKVGHIQAAVVVRQLRVSPNSLPSESVATIGYGLGANGRLNTGWIFEGDDLVFSAYAGKGLARYITDLDSFGGQDAVYDAATGRLEALPVAAAYFGYELGWTKQLRSTLQVGWVRVSNLDLQPAASLQKTLRGSGNLIWTPVPQLDFVAEFLAGKRWNKDGRWGESAQLQIGTRYFF
jgi:flagellar motor protein MotB